MIEGGAITIQSFIDKKIWDEARIFTTNRELNDGVKAPQVNKEVVLKTEVGGDKLNIIKND